MGKSEASGINENIVYARFRFYNRYQRTSETFQQFVSDVQELAKMCRFQNQEESLIRDRIIFGVNDIRLRNVYLCGGGDPTLDDVIETQTTFIKDIENFKDLNKDPIQIGSRGKLT